MHCFFDQCTSSHYKLLFYRNCLNLYELKLFFYLLIIKDFYSSFDTLAPSSYYFQDLKIPNFDLFPQGFVFIFLYYYFQQHDFDFLIFFVNQTIQHCFYTYFHIQACQKQNFLNHIDLQFACWLILFTLFILIILSFYHHIQNLAGSFLKREGQQVILLFVIAIGCSDSHLVEYFFDF